MTGTEYESDCTQHAAADGSVRHPERILSGIDPAGRTQMNERLIANKTSVAEAAAAIDPLFTSVHCRLSRTFSLSLLIGYGVGDGRIS